MSKSISLIALSSVCLMLSGCAQFGESLYSLGQETPENAPEGYHSYKMAQSMEQQNNIPLAAFNYCQAAELGHPKAKSKCLNLSYRAAEKEDVTNICKARGIDKKADQLCSLAYQNPTQAKAQIRAMLNQNNVKARIQKGEFGELKAEEF